MKSMSVMGAALGVLAMLCAASAQAAQLIVTSYDMINGYGQAHGGEFNYWDANYSNCVARDCTTDGAYLSGGLGKLTDGVIATQPWYEVSNVAGTGEYVGWEIQTPTILFHFGAADTVNEVKLYVDNSHVGGVTAPDYIVLDGTSYANPAWEFASAPETIDITGLHLIGNTISVTLRDPTQWVMLSEAQFYGVAGVPELSTWAMMLLGFAGLGFAGYRTSRKSASFAG